MGDNPGEPASSECASVAFPPFQAARATSPVFQRQSAILNRQVSAASAFLPRVVVNQSPDFRNGGHEQVVLGSGSRVCRSREQRKMDCHLCLSVPPFPPPELPGICTVDRSGPALALCSSVRRKLAAPEPVHLQHPTREVPFFSSSTGALRGDPDFAGKLNAVLGCTKGSRTRDEAHRQFSSVLFRGKPSRRNPRDPSTGLGQRKENQHPRLGGGSAILSATSWSIGLAD
ncbi:uncharacterized protein B0H64DRAFT_149970 [Chaetomium fimeti]|uniref:Uncharacterized protein n=1 Tax=Chaetomium fimeti TaxID=1854472 RepID=A0AAE0HFH0_9PEZI|nr:hypothetical protein B0H64DRAFT_149970 [Chaetomium fimeti]